jgi:hypothetical protein
MRGEILQDSKTGANPPSAIFTDHFFREELSRKIFEFHKSNEYFNIEHLYSYAAEDLEFKASKRTLYPIVLSMGYKYKKADGRRILMEQPHITRLKITFLKKYLQFKNEGVIFIFLDETWLYLNGSPVKMWVHSTDLRGQPAKVKSEGKRFTVLHAGCSDGFLDGCSLLLDTNINDRDYHKTMSGDLFFKWVKDQLLPALHKLSKKCIVMDNAPYHCMRSEKSPTSSSNKEFLQSWLRKKNVLVDNKSTKKELWSLIKPIIDHSVKKYKVDELLCANGYSVLRHCGRHCGRTRMRRIFRFLLTSSTLCIKLYVLRMHDASTR